MPLAAAIRPEPSPAKLQRTQGRGHLWLDMEEGQLRLKTLYQEGSAKLKLLPSPDRSLTDIVLINTAGGLTGGDDLSWRLDIGEDVKAVATTQACEKIYKSSYGAAHVQTMIKIGERAQFCWLPQETILFNAAQLKRHLQVDMAEGASCLICEPVIFGRRHMGETYLSGEMTDRWQISRGGKPIHLEALRLTPKALSHLSGFNGAGAAATLLFIGPKAEALYAELAKSKRENIALGFWAGKLMVRLTAQDGYDLRKSLFPILKELMQGMPLPKVWSL